MATKPKKHRVRSCSCLSCVARRFEINEHRIRNGDVPMVPDDDLAKARPCGCQVCKTMRFVEEDLAKAQKAENSLVFNAKAFEFAMAPLTSALTFAQQVNKSYDEAAEGANEALAQTLPNGYPAPPEGGWKTQVHGPLWRTADGNVLPVSTMSDSHLWNAIKFSQRKQGKVPSSLVAERERRKANGISVPEYGASSFKPAPVVKVKPQASWSVKVNLPSAADALANSIDEKLLAQIMATMDEYKPLTLPKKKRAKTTTKAQPALELEPDVSGHVLPDAGRGKRKIRLD